MSEKESQLVKEVKRHIIELKIKLEDLGMKPKMIEMFMGGRSVMDCPYCNTFNMYEIYNSGKKDYGYSMYECANCDKTWMKKEE